MSAYSKTVDQSPVDHNKIIDNYKIDESIFFWTFSILAMATLVIGVAFLFELVVLAVVALFGEGIVATILIVAAFIRYLLWLPEISAWIVEKAFALGHAVVDGWNWLKSKLGFGGSSKQDTKSGAAAAAVGVTAVAGVFSVTSRLAARQEAAAA